MTRTAFALLGPTASGKSRLALELAANQPLEIVSVDSALVYRGMDIGTAKPTPAERARVPHHVIDIIEPNEAYSTGRWRRDALHAVANILQQNKIPLLVGGTMLYYRSLVSGLDVLPQADAADLTRRQSLRRPSCRPSCHAAASENRRAFLEIGGPIARTRLLTARAPRIFLGNLRRSRPRVATSRGRSGPCTRGGRTARPPFGRPAGSSRNETGGFGT